MTLEIKQVFQNPISETSGSGPESIDVIYCWHSTVSWVAL